MPDRVAENLASRLASRLVALLHARDLDGLADVLAENVVRVDHRSGITADDIEGRDAYVAYVEASLAVGMVSGAVTPVVTYGDRHALIRGRWGDGDGMHLDFLIVAVTNEAGQAVHMVHYDPEDEERAREDVRVRYMSTSQT